MNTRKVLNKIKIKFAQTGNPAKIPLLKGSTFRATLTDDGINVDNLGTQPFLPWTVFQETVCLLIRLCGQARNGNAMKSKLGDTDLPLDSMEGHIANVVYGKKPGDWVFRRIVPISCILIWADVCKASPGRLILRK